MVLAFQIWLLIGGLAALLLRAQDELNLIRLLISLVLGPVLLVWSVYVGIKAAAKMRRDREDE